MLGGIGPAFRKTLMQFVEWSTIEAAVQAGLSMRFGTTSRPPQRKMRASGYLSAAKADS